MTKEREALKLALEALEEINKLSVGENAICLPAEIDTAMDACREALAQPEHEPFGYFRYDLRLDAWVQNREGRPGTPFYTTPPHRKPLTDEEIQKCYETTGHCQTLRPQDRFAVFALARAIEAKLKEKNT